MRPLIILLATLVLALLTLLFITTTPADVAPATTTETPYART
jgi:hypothetical protein